MRALREDFAAIRHNDPAARGVLETLLSHTTFHAIAIYRLAHALDGRIPLLPRLLSVFGDPSWPWFEARGASPASRPQ